MPRLLPFQGMLGEAPEFVSGLACHKQSEGLAHKTSINEPADRTVDT